MTKDQRCPHCNMRAYSGERFCWYCSEDLHKHDSACPECGQPRRLAAEVAKYVTESLRDNQA